MKTRFAVTLIVAALAAFCAAPASGASHAPAGRSAHGRAGAKKSHAVYVCVADGTVSQTPGTCPKCGMKLRKVDSRDITYSCPMDKDVVSKKPGRCPKCGMYLKLHVKAHTTKSAAVPKKG